jgi:exosortase
MRLEEARTVRRAADSAGFAGDSAPPRTGVWVAASLLVAAWVFFPILVYDPEYYALAEVWLEDDDYSYGLLIPPLVAYLLWEKRESLRRLPARGSAWGLAFLALALLFFCGGLLGGVNFLPRLAAVAAAAGAILWIGGPPWIRALAFPLLLFLLSIPIPRLAFIQIAFPLQVFASDVAERVLFSLGVPVMREGNVIHLPHASLEVAEACSGLRSLFALLTTGVVFAYFFGRSALQRLLMAVASVPIAILVNAARVAGTGYLAHHYGMEVATGYYHSLEGFAMFGIAFALLAVFGFGVLRFLPPRAAGPPS